MSDYRTRVYAKYATQFKDENTTFDEAGARKWGRPFAHYMRGWLPAKKDAAILDVACGNGFLLYFLKSQGYTNVNGIDISPEQVKLARQVVPGVIEGDVITHLEGNPEKYDLITAFDLIEHLTKDEGLRFLDACYGALRPGGRLILQLPNAESPWGGMIRYADFTHELGYTPDLLRRIMGLCGFSDATPRELGPTTIDLKSTLRLIAWKVIKAGLIVWNLAEVSYPGSGVLTRVFMISGVKR